jgi:hypothetical protein
MKIQQLKELAEQGKLKVSKSVYRTGNRRQYIYDKSVPMYIGHILNPEWPKISEVKRIPYTRYSYLATTPENEFYKITKQDYLTLSNIINAQR